MPALTPDASSACTRMCSAEISTLAASEFAQKKSCSDRRTPSRENGTGNRYNDSTEPGLPAPEHDPNQPPELTGRATRPPRGLLRQQRPAAPLGPSGACAKYHRGGGLMDLVSCPKCGAKVRADRLEQHMSKVHSVEELTRRISKERAEREERDRQRREETEEDNRKYRNDTEARRKNEVRDRNPWVQPWCWVAIAAVLMLSTAAVGANIVLGGAGLLTLAVAFIGYRVWWLNTYACKTCHGSGKCHICRGSGTGGHAPIRAAPGYYGATSCSTCHGSGVCHSCKGSGKETCVCPKCGFHYAWNGLDCSHCNPTPGKKDNVSPRSEPGAEADRRRD